MTANIEKVKAVFLEAIENIAPENWSPFLENACGVDVGLRRKVEALLSAHQKGVSHFDIRAASNERAGNLQSAIGPNATVGRYTLVRAIGEGGMGVVFLAEQYEPVRRQVALKIIQPGMASRHLIARFELERQALAMMDHPNIAKVLDADTSDEGLPYFVMELVNGTPITQFCDDNKLDIAQRLGLFVTVCQAVQHAHQKGVIHRDLKPNNVLVTSNDGNIVPKVIDFGVAKALSERLTEQTVVTHVGQIIGTLEYMSPEQAGVNVRDTDTTSDVYSLGTILYELLTGDTPLGHARVKHLALDQLLYSIREVDPPRPSVGAANNELLHINAARRKLEPPKLIGSLRGELDCIVMKALDKDRSRRYESAIALARDLNRYLVDEPIEARVHSIGYRFRKLVKRQRLKILVAMLIVLIGISAIVATRRVFDAEIVRAEVDAHKNIPMLRWSAQVITLASFNHSQQTNLMQMVSATQILNQELGIVPDVNLRRQFDESYPNGNEPWPTHLRVSHLLTQLPASQTASQASAYYFAGRLDEAICRTRQLLAIKRAALGPEHTEVLDLSTLLATVYSNLGDHEKAMPLLEEVLEVQRRIVSLDKYGKELSLLSRVRMQFSKSKQPNVAEAVDRKLVELQEQIQRARNDIAPAMIRLAKCYQSLGYSERALPLYEQVYHLRISTVGLQDQVTISAKIDLGLCYITVGRFAQAVTLLGEKYDDDVEGATSKSMGTAWYVIVTKLVDAYTDLGEYGKAESCLLEWIEMAKQQHGLTYSQPPIDPLAWIMENNKAINVEPIIRERLAMCEAKRPGGWQAFYCKALLGHTFLSQTRYSDAQQLLLEAYNGLKVENVKAVGTSQRYNRMIDTLERLIELYSEWDKPEEADKWRAILAAASRPATSLSK